MIRLTLPLNLAHNLNRELLRLVHLKWKVLKGDASLLLLLQGNDHLFLSLVFLLQLQQTGLQVLVLLLERRDSLQVDFVALLQIFGGFEDLLRLNLVALQLLLQILVLSLQRDNHALVLLDHLCKTFEDLN